MKIQVSEDECFPYYFVDFPDDERDEYEPFRPNVELSEAEAIDLRRVKAEHAAWQARLKDRLDHWRVTR